MMLYQKFYKALALCLALTVCLGAAAWSGGEHFVYGAEKAAAAGRTVSAKQLSAPSGVKALSSGSSAIQLSWKKVSGAKQYQIYRYYSKSGQWKQARTTASVSVRFTGLAKKTTYRYKVRAVSGSAKSSFSSQVSAKTGVTTRISLNKSLAELYAGQTVTLKATVTAGAPSKTVTWSSSDKTVAAVSKTGKVTALKEGTAVITARAHNGAVATARIHVLKPQDSETSRPSGPSEPSQPSDPSAPSAAEYEERFNTEMLRLVNQLRKAEGKSLLSYRTEIQKAADTRAKEAILRPDLGHQRYDKNGSLKSFSSVFSDLNLNIKYTAAGENLAWRGYQASPEAAAQSLFNQWKNSAGHLANMLDNGYTSMATAIAYDKSGTAGYRYTAAAVQLFMR